MRLDYFLYMSEAEGQDQFVSTRTARINAAINDFVDMARKGYDINSGALQNSIFNRHSLDSLSKEECDYIRRRVSVIM